MLGTPISLRTRRRKVLCVDGGRGRDETLTSITDLAATTVRMAQRYGHISTDARRAAMEAMNAPRPKLTEAEGDDETASAEKQGAVH